MPPVVRVAKRILEIRQEAFADLHLKLFAGREDTASSTDRRNTC
jgi:hypothetical protein